MAFLQPSRTSLQNLCKISKMGLIFIFTYDNLKTPCIYGIFSLLRSRYIHEILVTYIKFSKSSLINTPDISPRNISLCNTCFFWSIVLKIPWIFTHSIEGFSIKFVVVVLNLYFKALGMSCCFVSLFCCGFANITYENLDCSFSLLYEITLNKELKNVPTLNIFYSSTTSNI